jgi:hypothetical protein
MEDIELLDNYEPGTAKYKPTQTDSGNSGEAG